MKKTARSAFLALTSLAAAVSPASAASDGSCIESSAPPAFAAVAAAVSGAAALTSAPSPERFATVWTSYFAGAVRSASGTDGRMSISEAKKLAESGSIFGDNAVNWLNAKGQQSVDVDKLIQGGWNYAFATGKKIAGDDGRISLEDAKGLPKDLQDDYRFLRGKLDAPVPAGNLLADLGKATEGLWLMSEGDAKVIPLEAASSGSGAISADEVRAAFGAKHDELMQGDDVWGYDNADYVPIADRFPEVRDASTWLGHYSTSFDPDDTVSVANAAKWKTVGELMNAGLTNVSVIRFNERAAPADAITSSIFFVGRTADGKLVGVLSGAVET